MSRHATAVTLTEPDRSQTALDRTPTRIVHCVYVTHEALVQIALRIHSADASQLISIAHTSHAPPCTEGQRHSDTGQVHRHNQIQLPLLRYLRCLVRKDAEVSRDRILLRSDQDTHALQAVWPARGRCFC